MGAVVESWLLAHPSFQFEVFRIARCVLPPLNPLEQTVFKAACPTLTAAEAHSVHDAPLFGNRPHMLLAIAAPLRRLVVDHFATAGAQPNYSASRAASRAMLH
jgi:hypothetical protein